ncbi:hypothetical protein CFOL_v3_27518, partial [Cephalotus follicularis]
LNGKLNHLSICCNSWLLLNLPSTSLCLNKVNNPFTVTGCPNYKTLNHCKFFKWYDNEIVSKPKEVILQQRDVINSLKHDVFVLTNEKPDNVLGLISEIKTLKGMLKEV